MGELSHGIVSQGRITAELRRRGVEGKPETSGAAKTCGHAPEVTSKPLFRAVSGKPETEVWPSPTTSTVLTVAAPAT